MRYCRVLAVLTLIAISCNEAEMKTDKTPEGSLQPPRIAEPAFPDRTYNVRDFGATGSGKEADTEAVQAAITRCHEDGGGSVVFPEGTYMVASVRLLSNVRLSLDANAVITGASEGYLAPEPNPYAEYQDAGHSHFRNAVLFGEDVENVAIEGGTINGGGAKSGAAPGGGDKVISIRVGRNLVFRNVRHETGAHFVYLLNDCENLIMTDLTILKSRDGVDLMGCRNVAVSGCHFTGLGDDAVGIKSDYALGRKVDSSNIAVWDCYFETNCNAVQFGSETAGDFSDIRVWDITVGKACKAGIGITCNDGAIIDGVEFNNIRIRNANIPIFLLVTDRLRTGEPNATVGSIRNVRIRNVVSTDPLPHHRRSGRSRPITLSGLPDSHLENIVLENIRVTLAGEGTADQASLTPPYTKRYEPRQLKIRPSSGLFARHVHGLTLRNVEFRYQQPDYRPPVMIWDARDVKVDGLRSSLPEGVDMMRTQKVEGLQIRDSEHLADTP